MNKNKTFKYVAHICVLDYALNGNLKNLALKDCPQNGTRAIVAVDFHFFLKIHHIAQKSSECKRNWK